MTSNADNIFRRPASRPCPHQGEFRWEGQAIAIDSLNIGVDAGDKGLAKRLGVEPIGAAFCIHIAAIKEQARCLVLGQVAGAEVSREQAKAALAPKINLPKPVARSIEPLRKEQVGRGAGLNMRNAPPVDTDSRRLLQA